MVQSDVAELRHRLPKGAVVQNYEFKEGPTDLNAVDTPTRAVRLGELFNGENRPLVVYHFRYEKRNTSPCSMCTSLMDGYNGVAHHLAQKLHFASGWNSDQQKEKQG